MVVIMIEFLEYFPLIEIKRGGWRFSLIFTFSVGRWPEQRTYRQNKKVN